ncbi:unnamed protein product [Amoebophrya sp. A25]|nr:unnamed protein product [Amoebophrya sp. A25]|eukprot:GSA25T00017192001.1
MIIPAAKRGEQNRPKEYTHKMKLVSSRRSRLSLLPIILASTTTVVLALERCTSEENGVYPSNCLCRGVELFRPDLAMPNGCACTEAAGGKNEMQCAIAHAPHYRTAEDEIRTFVSSCSSCSAARLRCIDGESYIVECAEEGGLEEQLLTSTLGILILSLSGVCAFAAVGSCFHFVCCRRGESGRTLVGSMLSRSRDRRKLNLPDNAIADLGLGVVAGTGGSAVDHSRHYPVNVPPTSLYGPVQTSQTPYYIKNFPAGGRLSGNGKSGPYNRSASADGRKKEESSPPESKNFLGSIFGSLRSSSSSPAKGKRKSGRKSLDNTPNLDPDAYGGYNWGRRNSRRSSRASSEASIRTDLPFLSSSLAASGYMKMRPYYTLFEVEIMSSDPVSILFTTPAASPPPPSAPRLGASFSRNPGSPNFIPPPPLGMPPAHMQV